MAADCTVQRPVRQPLAERVRDSLRLRALDVKDRLSGRGGPPRAAAPAGLRRATRTSSRPATSSSAHFVELGGLQPDRRRARRRLRDRPDGAPAGGLPRRRRARTTASTSTARASAGAGAATRGTQNFRFQVADLYNRRYNPHGAHAATEYRFPYDDARFDFAILTSVLTHLLEDEADHYLAETARVLKPGGRVLDDVLPARRRVARADRRRAQRRCAFLEPAGARRGGQRRRARGGRRLRRGLGARARSRAHGLRASTPIHPGTWCGPRRSARRFQDIVVADSAA